MQLRLGLCSAAALLAASGLFAQTPGAAAPAPPPTRTPVVRSPGNADWAATLVEARQRAAAEKKLVFVEFGDHDCGNCGRMDSLLYNALDFESLLIGTVPVKVELKSNEGKPLADKFEIQEAPAVLITTPEGRLVFLMQGFQNAPDFYQHARNDVSAYRTFAKKIDAQDVATLPAAEALATGRELYQRHDPAAALPRFERAAKAPDATPAIRGDALEAAAAAQLELGQPAASLKTIEKILATTQNEDRRERAEIFRAQIPLSQNNPTEALRLFQQFKKAHPKSRYIAGVDAVIQKLELSKPQ